MSSRLLPTWLARNRELSDSESGNFKELLTPYINAKMFLHLILEKISACALNSAVVSGQRDFVPRAVTISIPVQWLQEASSSGYQPQLPGGVRKMFAAFISISVSSAAYWSSKVVAMASFFDLRREVLPAAQGDHDFTTYSGTLPFLVVFCRQSQCFPLSTSCVDSSCSFSQI